MGRYKVTQNEQAKNIKMELSGYFSDEDAMNFVNDFIKMSKKVNAEDTYLLLDCARLHLYPNEVFTKLRGIFSLYKESGFKKVRMVLYPAQKALGVKFEKLAVLTDLNLDLLVTDMLSKSDGDKVKF